MYIRFKHDYKFFGYKTNRDRTRWRSTILFNVVVDNICFLSWIRGQRKSIYDTQAHRAEIGEYAPA
jgi:hypothetical protein